MTITTDEEAAVYVQAHFRAFLVRRKKLKLVKRKYVLRELVVTEENYCKSLSFVLENYVQPLQHAIDTGNAIVDQERYDTLFCGFQNVSELSETFLSLLKERSEHVTYYTKVGDIFIDLAADSNSPLVQAYEKFINGYTEAVAAYTKSKTEPKFKSFEKIVREKNRLTLKDFLIMPVQRVTRYPLLLETLKGKTIEDQDDYPFLADAITAMKKLAMLFDKKKREFDSKIEVERLPERVKNLWEPILQNNRRLVSEIDCIELLPNEMRRRGKLFILNDIMLFATYPPTPENVSSSSPMPSSPACSLQTNPKQPLGKASSSTGVNIPLFSLSTQSSVNMVADPRLDFKWAAPYSCSTFDEEKDWPNKKQWRKGVDNLALLLTLTERQLKIENRVLEAAERMKKAFSASAKAASSMAHQKVLVAEKMVRCLTYQKTCLLQQLALDSSEECLIIKDRNNVPLYLVLETASQLADTLHLIHGLQAKVKRQSVFGLLDQTITCDLLTMAVSGTLTIEILDSSDINSKENLLCSVKVDGNSFCKTPAIKGPSSTWNYSSGPQKVKDAKDLEFKVIEVKGGFLSGSKAYGDVSIPLAFLTNGKTYSMDLDLSPKGKLRTTIQIQLDDVKT